MDRRDPIVSEDSNPKPRPGDLHAALDAVVQSAERQVTYQLTVVEGLGPVQLESFRALTDRPQLPHEPELTFAALREERRATATLEALAAALADRRRSHREAIDHATAAALESLQWADAEGRAHARAAERQAAFRVEDAFTRLETAIESSRAELRRREMRLSERTRQLWRRICFWGQHLPARDGESMAEHDDRVLRAAVSDLAATARP